MDEPYPRDEGDVAAFQLGSTELYRQASGRDWHVLDRGQGVSAV